MCGLVGSSVPTDFALFGSLSWLSCVSNKNTELKYHLSSLLWSISSCCYCFQGQILLYSSPWSISGLVPMTGRSFNIMHLALLGPENPASQWISNNKNFQC